jgi:glycosyltransferase involved in cell wall biosynthesis
VDRDRDPWIVVPAFNEEALLAESLQQLCQQYANVVVVDDGSTDDTENIAARFQVFVLRHLMNRGQGAALRTGLDFALARGAQVIVTFDADGQHAVEDVDGLVQPVLQGDADVVLGSRFLGSTEGIPTSRRWILRLGVLFTRLFSRVKITDTHNGLRAFSREAAMKIPIAEDGMAHASEILDEIRRQGFRYCEVPVRVRYSRRSLQKGQSNWNSLRIAGKFLLGRILR